MIETSDRPNAISKFYCLITMGYLLFEGCANGALHNPCPNVFQYKYDSYSNLYGEIAANTPSENGVIRLEVELQVGNTVRGFNGNLELVRSRVQAAEDAYNWRPLHYKVIFPYWTGEPPRITKIAVNGQQICLGTPLDRRNVPVLTTITLDHTLRITGRPNRQWSSPPIQSNPQLIFSDFGELSPREFPRDEDSDVQIHLINFNPHPPDNPKKMYANNPFFSRITTTSTVLPPVDIRNGLDANPFLNNVRPSLEGDASISGIPFMFNSGKQKPIQNPFLVNFDPNRNKHQQPLNLEGDVTNKLPETFKRPSITSTTTFQPRQTSTLSPPKTLSKWTASGQCGLAVRANQLVINGEGVSRGAHPWLAALFLQNTESAGLQFRCGGSLISHKHVVTAAHCVSKSRRVVKPQEVLVVMGRQNIQKWANDDDAQIMEASSVHVHPDYQKNSADADIAVLVLVRGVEFTEFIRPVCLWTGDSDLESVVGVSGTVVGWGKDEFGKMWTQQPKQIAYPIVSQETCLTSNESFREITSVRSFCAGYRNNSGPCNGDSGGGFLIQQAGRWTLRGIVSLSLFTADSNCDLNSYVVFTDAAKFIDWLSSFLK